MKKKKITIESPILSEDVSKIAIQIEEDEIDEQSKSVI